jgi:pimeloyl-ACP methyl ester carboxylesterase
MLQHIGPIDVSRKLFKKLRSCENAKNGKLRVWDYGYDWRLSPHILSQKLQDFLQKLPSNQPGSTEPKGALVIAHSLGGVITRHAVNQRPELFSGVLYAGVPQRCINVLGPLRNGDVILLNEKLLTAKVNFSVRTSFVFLPEDGFCFVDKKTGESYNVNFHDPQDWIKYRLSPCMGSVLPAYTRPPPSGFSSLLPSSLRPRSDSKLDKHNVDVPAPRDRTIAPQMEGSGPPPDGTDPIPEDELERNVRYLTRTLEGARRFRSELAHSESHQNSNSYPPFALMYGKTIPTVYAVQVHAREAIPCADVYDDLLFRPGDGVVLAKEAMLPEGYSLVRGGRISTERGHITMLGDLPAVGRALQALIRGRQRGIGLAGTQVKTGQSEM